MKSIRLATTLLHSLRPVGASGERDHGLLTETLKRELGEAAAGFFAEPVTAKDGSRIDWYVWAQAKPEPIETLRPEERADLAALVEARRAEILALAGRLEAGSRADADAGRALRHALAMPAEGTIFRVDGRPVAICWGYVEAGRPNYESGLKALAAPRPRPLSQPVPARGATLAAPVPSLAAVPAVRAAAWPGLAILLWVLFALLTLAVLWLLLASPFAQRLGFVPAALTRFGLAAPLASEASLVRLDGLRADVVDLERRTTEVLAACATATAAAAPQAETLGARIARSGAQGGALQLSLLWDGPADLDLSALCPDGSRISYQNPAACGGTLDVDANGRLVSQAPVENIFWPPGAAIPAELPVDVTYFGARGDPRPEIPYRLRIRRTLPDPATGIARTDDAFVDGVARSAETGTPRRVRTIASDLAPEPLP